MLGSTPGPSLNPEFVGITCGSEWLVYQSHLSLSQADLAAVTHDLGCSLLPYRKLPWSKSH